MNSLQFEIARFLAAKAAQGQRTTYQQVGEAIGWNHPTGRGLGKNLEVILRYLHDSGLPALTTILVRKGEKYPADDAMAYIRGVVGDVDIDAAQKEAFDFDWSRVPELQLESGNLPGGRDGWLTSFWGFDPSDWGYVGFADENKRSRFLRLSKPGTLFAVYVTKNKGPKEMRGKVVGVMEVSHETGHAKDFMSGDRWREKELDPDSKGKWLFGVRATRAWRIIPEDWKTVDELMPSSYSSDRAEFIGSSGVKLDAEEMEHLLQLDVEEVPVYKGSNIVDSTLQTLANSLSPSRAIPPASAPYLVGETDGPKHLYILKLRGDIAAYLGRSKAEVEDKSIIKVGFSKSPLTRRNQIQSAYPLGAFHWDVYLPSPAPETAPYQSASIAIIGEDAMKRRLVEENAEILGGEFFLAEDWLVRKAWAAGNHQAQTAQDEAERSDGVAAKGAA